jgi:uncharacterized protein YdeI (YjbR/CyaY-like superfamily)
VDPTFFVTAPDFRAWLERHHEDERELWVGFHKKGSGRPSITWPEAVDQALCFGWIDGVRKGIDDASYMIRFTPRSPTSTWSNVNVGRMAELMSEGLVEPAGRRAFERRTADRSGVYSFEQADAAALSDAQEARFRADERAWAFFSRQPPGYRRTAVWWVVSAKREETRARRLESLISDSADGRRVALLRRPERNNRP